MFVANNADDIFRDAIRASSHGLRVESRVGGSSEALGYGFKLTNPLNNVVRNKRRCMSPIYAAAEMIWYMKATGDGSMISHYAPQYKNFLHGGIALGAYGPILFDHCVIEDIRRELQEKENTRRAVIPIFDQTNLFTLDGSKDTPCTTSLQLLPRAGKLHMVATMRSNDVWLGLPYDLFCFTTYQAIWAHKLGLELGDYIHNVGSMHLYDKNAEAAREALDHGTYWYEPDEVSYEGYDRDYIIQQEYYFRTDGDDLRPSTNHKSINRVLVDLVKSHYDGYTPLGLTEPLQFALDQYRETNRN